MGNNMHETLEPSGTSASQTEWVDMRCSCCRSPKMLLKIQPGASGFVRVMCKYTKQTYTVNLAALH